MIELSSIQMSQCYLDSEMVKIDPKSFMYLFHQTYFYHNFFNVSQETKENPQRMVADLLLLDAR